MTTPSQRRSPGPLPIPAVILAGGLSSRMGRNKALILLGGETLVARVAGRIAAQAASISLNAGDDFATGLRIVPDTVKGRLGPLAGVLAALSDTAIRHPDASHVATVPIDSPFFPLDLLARLADAVAGRPAIAIASSAGQDHPVFSLWPVSIADDLEDWLRRDEKRRVRDFLLRHRTERVEFPLIETHDGPLDPFFNINRPDDLAVAQKWLEVLPA